jgi:hypothetical protein
MTTFGWKSGEAYHRSLSAPAGTAAAETEAVIEVAPLGAAREGVSGSGSARAAPREAPEGGWGPGARQRRYLLSGFRSGSIGGGRFCPKTCPS